MDSVEGVVSYQINATIKIADFQSMARAISTKARAIATKARAIATKARAAKILSVMQKFILMDQPLVYFLISNFSGSMHSVLVLTVIQVYFPNLLRM